MIIASIDVTLLDKARFKTVTRRNGDKAVFAEIVLIETPNSEHGDFMCKQGVTKEEREQRVEMPILGNAKSVGGKRTQQHNDEPEQRRERTAPQRPARTAPSQPVRQRQAPPPDPDLDAPSDDIPW